MNAPPGIRYMSSWTIGEGRVWSIMYTSTKSPQAVAFIGTEDRKTAASAGDFGTDPLLSDRCGGKNFMIHAVRIKETRPKKEKSRSDSSNDSENMSGTSMTAGMIGMALKITCRSMCSTVQ